MSTDPQILVERYLDLFNTTDDEQRGRLAAELFDADVRYVDPMAEVVGPDQVAGFVGAVQEQFPGYRFSLGSDPDAHHDQLRMTWHATAPGDTEPTAVGLDVIVHRDGRIQQVLGFLDGVPG